MPIRKHCSDCSQSATEGTLALTISGQRLNEVLEINQNVMQTFDAVIVYRLLLPCLVMTLLFACGGSIASAEQESDIFGGPKLHAIEKQIESIAIANNAKPGKQAEEELQKQLSNILDSIKDPMDLATLATWSELNSPSNEYKKGLVDYGQIMSDVQSSCIGLISRIGGPSADSALKEVIYQSNIDGHKSEELRASMSSLHKKQWEFPVRVYVGFSDKKLSETPLKIQSATYRYEVCRDLWKAWWKEHPESKPPLERGNINTQLTALANGQISHLKVEAVPDSITGAKFDEQQVKVVEDLVRKAIEGKTLPPGIKRVKVSIDFWGR